MQREIRLNLASGEEVTVSLPDPGDFISWHVLSMGYSGNTEFWNLLAQLMAAAGRPVFAFNESLRKLGHHFGELAPDARLRLLSQRGYGLGILFDADCALQDPAIADT